jgi:hypothetical protein
MKPIRIDHRYNMNESKKKNVISKEKKNVISKEKKNVISNDMNNYVESLLNNYYELEKILSERDAKQFIYYEIKNKYI